VTTEVAKQLPVNIIPVVTLATPERANARTAAEGPQLPTQLANMAARIGNQALIEP